MPTIVEYRADLDVLQAEANNELAEMLTQVGTVDAARELLADELPQLVALYGSAAGALAADWYEEARSEASIAGRFRALVADLPDLGRTDSLANWATAPTTTGPTDLPTALIRVQGGVQRIVADVGRQTISESAVADPQARGWQRVGAGECDFCSMLIARGVVYTRGSVDFGSHDHCKCAAVPAWDGQPVPVKPYTPTGRRISDADRARVRRWLAEHGV